MLFREARRASYAPRMSPQSEQSGPTQSEPPERVSEGSIQSESSSEPAERAHRSKSAAVDTTAAAKTATSPAFSVRCAIGTENGHTEAVGPRLVLLAATAPHLRLPMLTYNRHCWGQHAPSAYTSTSQPLNSEHHSDAT